MFLSALMKLLGFYHVHVDNMLFSTSLASFWADYGVIRTLCNGRVKIERIFNEILERYLFCPLPEFMIMKGNHCTSVLTIPYQ